MRKCLILVYSLLVAIGANAQTLSVDSIQKTFNNYRISDLQEKLFVHTDRDNYVAGELCWFKIYNVDASFHRPLKISSVAYVEVIDNTNKVVLQTKVELKNGRGNGSLYLPVATSSGNYRFRSYTRWMKNNSPQYYFEKNITVINTLYEPVDTVLKSETKYDLQFFPEGGNLVNNLKSKVAFRMTDINGKGIDFQGVVKDENGVTVSEFRSLKFGIGNFSFTPSIEHNYKAIVRLTDGIIITKHLPKVYENGYVMQLTDETNLQRLRIGVHYKGNFAKGISLFVHSRNRIEVMETKQLTNNYAEFTISKNDLKDGISHITVFDSYNKPVCERLYFNKREEFLQIQSAADKVIYGQREKASLTISVSDKLQENVSANMSVSVFRADSLQQYPVSDIGTYFLLSSDLAGTVEQPEYYLKGNTMETDQALDNLMLTHGWRRFKWETIFNHQAQNPGFIPELNGHIISAKAIYKTQQLSSPPPVFLAVTGKNVQFYEAQENSKETLNFFTKGIFGKNEIIIQSNTEKDSVTRFDIISPFSEKYSDRSIPAFRYPFNTRQTLLTNSINMQAMNIYYKDQLGQYKKQHIDSLSFYGKPDEHYLLDNYTRFPTIEEVLREYVVGVGIRMKAGKPNMLVYTGTKEASFFDEEPLVLMDGVPVLKQARIFSYDPLKVKSIEVMTKRYFYGSSTFGGIINFTTYQGDLQGFDANPHATVLDYEGLQQQREFYSPVYDTAYKLTSRLPDFRNLLFWAPDIDTKKDGKSQISFYTSDREGRYIGVIQGLSSEGKFGMQIFSFDVKNNHL